MKTYAVAAAAALALSVGSAFAADVPVKTAPVAAPAPAAPVWDIAFGGVVMSDYNFRGISQSNRGASAGAYFEPQYNSPVGTFYVGLGGVGIDWPSGPGYGFTAPSAEIDYTGGWRNTFGKFGLDIGVIYYHYPKESFNGATSQSDFWEVYVKTLYAVTPDITLGANVFYTPDLLHYSTTFAALGISNKPDAIYASLTGKWVLPWKQGDFGVFVSGEVGHWWIDDAGFTHPLAVLAGLVGTDPSYTYWNAGLAFTYKALTLDLRYHGTDQSVRDCNSFLLVTPGNLSSNWCDDTFIVAIKVDTSASALK
jgi:uncharacterized protein (TIGR02001 family)